MIKLRPSMEIGRRTLGDNVTGAEIGVLGGTNAISILENWPQVKMLHLVDSYGGIDESDAKFKEWVKRFDPLAGRMCWHIMTSVNTAGLFEERSLDFVYIDANHGYKQVTADLLAWAPKVRAGGLLAGHDYFTYGSVKDAVTAWAKERDLWVFSTEPDWWIFLE